MTQEQVATRMGVGDLADLDEAVAASREAVAATPDDHPARAAFLSNLGLALRTRFDHLGDLADLDGGAAAGRQAVAATPDDHPARAMYLSNLGLALQTRFERVGEPADIDEAVAASRQAVAAAPKDHPDVARYSSNLCGALRTRFERAGDFADIDEAVAAGRRAVAATPANHPDLNLHLSNLAIALLTRFESTGEPADIDEAVEVSRQAAAAAALDHPNRAACLSNLGTALRARFKRTGQSDDYVATEEAFAACAQTDAASPLIRARAGRAWAELAAGVGDWATATRAFDATIALLPRLVDRRIGSESRQHHVAGFDELGTDAAAAALNAHTEPTDAAHAVAALEQGRGIMLRQGLDTRANIADLRRQRPNLAGEVDRLRELLNADAAMSLGAGAGQTNPARVVDRRRLTAEEWERLLANIRSWTASHASCCHQLSPNSPRPPPADRSSPSMSLATAATR